MESRMSGEKVCENVVQRQDEEELHPRQCSSKRELSLQQEFVYLRRDPP